MGKMKQYKGKLFNDILQQGGFSVAYDGDLKDGKPDGTGRAYYKDGRIYEGEWKDSQPHGQGKLYYANLNLWYEGEWKNGKREGLGTSYYEDGSPAFAGEWKNGNPLK
ncbi:MAG: hypothetical protein PHC92_08455 [Syntrophomonadaceae bacterium]|nr:hypothetical protein [Syntrophomonadaceae bacterium]MDD3024306.1 hypothetical protein [Syntrophomonadaceae bacterium]